MPERYSLRIVIQQFGASETASYRIVVYGERQPSLDALLQVLRLAVPDFDKLRLFVPAPGQSGSRIVFAEEMHLTVSQLGLLRLEH